MSEVRGGEYDGAIVDALLSTLWHTRWHSATRYL